MEAQSLSVPTLGVRSAIQPPLNAVVRQNGKSARSGCIASSSAAAARLRQKNSFCQSVQAFKKRVQPLRQAQLPVLASATNPSVKAVAAEPEVAPLDVEDSLAAYVQARGGKRVIRKILVANNGMAAAKCIMSMRRWAFLNLGSEKALYFVAMATPEDLEANAEFIRSADDYIEVPGGKNSNNYANVNLIVNLAVREGVDAVWPGWGHASENPKLPSSLKDAGIQFIGPTAPVMSVLGDKIAANILAQTAEVPSIPWSGDGLTADLNEEGTIPDDIFNKATVTSEEEALSTAEKVGFPIMIKASEGGGGKGIRKCTNVDEVITAYAQVTAEVPGSPVFMMQLCSEARHLEVQIVGDEHGNAVALNGRDCSTQRRFQKIFEEGPPTIAKPEVFRQMEKSAQRLCQNIGYIGAGTVEYLYNAASASYFFLELNPRLQVEHPVTEGITGVNLPATQLQVAMGIPLNCIPEVRRFYGRDSDGTDSIDFMEDDYIMPKKHVIAARITAENPDEGFKPTSGKIDRIRFQSSPTVWGYFSVQGNGAVHEFADSQFGHLFAQGNNREEARKALVLALKELLVRGEIRTAVDYLVQLGETEAFKDNTIDTSWLDKLIAERLLNEANDPQLTAAAAAVCRAYNKFKEEESNLAEVLKKGQQPSNALLKATRSATVEVTVDSVKYAFTALKVADDSIQFSISGFTFTAKLREQSDGTILAAYAGTSHKLSAQEEALGLRLEIDGKTVLIPTVFDPSELRSDVNGKVVRYLQEDGAEVETGKPFAEVEAMKMVMPVISTETGVIKHAMSAGSVIEPGDLLASLTLRDPSRVKKIDVFSGEFCIGEGATPPPKDVLEELRMTKEDVFHILDGFPLPVEDTVQRLLKCLSDPQLFICVMKEAAEEVGAAMPEALKTKIESGALQHGQDLANELKELQALSLTGMKTPAELAPLEAAASSFKDGRWGYALQTFTDIIVAYVEVEKEFAGRSYDAAVARVKSMATNQAMAVKMLQAHASLENRTNLVKSILGQLPTLPQRCNVSEGTPYTKDFPSVLKKLSALEGRAYGEMALMSSNIREERRIAPFEQRLTELKDVLTGRIGLRRIWGNASIELATDSSDSSEVVGGNESLTALVYSPTLGVDLLPPLFVDPSNEVRSKALEVYVRRVYRAHMVTYLTVESSTDGEGDSAFWQFHFRDTSREEAPNRCGWLNVVKNTAEIESSFEEVLSKYETAIASAEHDNLAPDDMVNVLHFAVTAEDSVGDIAERMEMLLAPHADRLKKMRMRMVNLIVNMDARPHLHFTFTNCLDYQEDSLRRNMRPTFTHLLELPRLSNYELQRIPTINRDLYILLGTGEKAKGARGGPTQRLFLRRISHSTDLLEGGMSRMLTKALDAIELAERDVRVEETTPSSIFINVMPSFKQLDSPATVAAVEAKLVDFIAKNATRLLKLKVDEVEFKVRATGEGHTNPLRVVASSKTGQWLKIDSYVEFPNPITGMAQNFCSFANTDRCFIEPYAMSSKVELKRAVARRVGTTYAYDFLGLFEKSLVQVWEAYTQENPSITRPEILFKATELVLNDDMELVEKPLTSIGENKIAMVGWHCTMCTPEVPEGREMILISSDVSVKSGSFGVAEDDFFHAASQYATKLGVPRIYIACNSGARIGLVDELKPLVKIAWNDASNPSLGFEYLYLSDEDFKASKEGSVNTIEKQVDGETRHVLKDIIGTTHGIGVENLRGSGMIAGETSRAYTETFTLSYVTGRSVGIGAYLCRLGQRTIQMSNGPMILTGYSALNKLLGRNVYTSQDQLGGPQIMIPNGVAHMEVTDDQEGVLAMLRWMSYVPKKMGALPPQISSADPVDRKVDFIPSKTPYDPRHMLGGVTNEDGSWTSGLFDKGSWTETLAEWGKSVCVGRARLGGIPVGVVSVETRAMSKTLPADPADPESSAQVQAQAGQVWFPDSAYKTAQAIQDFNNGEQLPLFIFANWRGFSGGTRDMYNEVLKFGAMIVDSLREYKRPVFVYIPPGGELRGGAWVVVDPTINEEMMEMYADVEARGGILEPPGICEVKYRRADQISTMHRLDSKLIELDADPEKNAEAIAKREETLLPIYLQVAHEFADLHDRAGRMEAKGVIRKALEWESSREFFFWRLKRRLQEDELSRKLKECGADAKAEIQALAGDAYDDDQAFLDWLESNKDTAEARLSEVKTAHTTKLVKELLASLDDSTRSSVVSEL